MKGNKMKVNQVPSAYTLWLARALHQTIKNPKKPMKSGKKFMSKGKTTFGVKFLEEFPARASAKHVSITSSTGKLKEASFAIRRNCSVRFILFSFRCVKHYSRSNAFNSSFNDSGKSHSMSIRDNK